MRAAGLLLAGLLASFPGAQASGYSSTSWTCEQQEFDIFVCERFFRALNRSGMRNSSPRGFPFKSDRVAIAAGLIEGQQRFFPNQSDVKIRLLAFSMCETQGNSIDITTRWGREVGWTGWNINILRCAAAFWGIDFPRSDSRAIARIKSDHRFAGYLTMAGCAAYASEIGGFESALAVKTFGFRGYGREYAVQGPNVRSWMRSYRKWLAITEAAYRWDGVSPVSASLYGAMSGTPFTTPDRRTR